jgi:hypothetical protein
MTLRQLAMTLPVTWTQEPDEGFVATIEDPFGTTGVYRYRYRAAILEPDSPHFIRERGHKTRAAQVLAAFYFDRKRADREFSALPRWMRSRLAYDLLREQAP